MPAWAHAAAALTIVVALLATARVVPLLLLVAPLVAAALGRRFSLAEVRVTIDERGLWLGEALCADRASVRDAWFDREDTDVRVTVAYGAGAFVPLHVENAEQARRLVAALLPSPHDHRVAGVRPRPLDALGPLRFLCAAAAYVVESGSPLGLTLALFALPGLYGLVRGAQLDAGPEALVVRTLFGERRLRYEELARGELEARLPSSVVRDPLLGGQPWTRRAHARVLAYVAARPTLGVKPEMERGAET